MDPYLLVSEMTMAQHVLAVLALAMVGTCIVLGALCVVLALMAFCDALESIFRQSPAVATACDDQGSAPPAHQPINESEP